MDQLPTIGSDTGPREAVPVVILSANGQFTGSAMEPLGYVQVALTVGQPYTISPPTGSRMVLIKPEGADMRYRDDGTAPTASIGMPVADGESLLYDVKLTQLQLTAQDAGCICNLSYYGDA